MLKVAIIGMGKRVMGMYRLMNKLDPDVQITGLVDPNPQLVRERLAEHKIETPHLKEFASVDEIVARRNEFDGVIIGTRCQHHTPLAVKLAKADLPLFLEKPVSITYQQLEQLAEAYQGKEDRVLVSFPLRVTPLFRDALEIVKSGRLGVINQIQAFNNVAYGDIYYHYWYRDFAENGGLWLQKATHDVDYINLLAGSTPVSVAAMISRQVYDKPELDKAMASYSKLKDQPDCPVHHQDSGSAIIMYDNGLHANYTQNFVSRKSAGCRGATIIGHAATLRFDWKDDSLVVIEHQRHRIDRIEIKPTDEGHGGGDHVLSRNFIAMMRGQEKAMSDLSHGLLSAAMCLAARESANTHTFQPVVVPGKSKPRTGPRAVEVLA